MIEVILNFAIKNNFQYLFSNEILIFLSFMKGVIFVEKETFTFLITLF